jgi:hypothetical protein
MRAKESAEKEATLDYLAREFDLTHAMQQNRSAPRTPAKKKEVRQKKKIISQHHLTLPTETTAGLQCGKRGEARITCQ